jgi:hypothetical protein
LLPAAGGTVRCAAAAAAAVSNGINGAPLQQLIFVMKISMQFMTIV